MRCRGLSSARRVLSQPGILPAGAIGPSGSPLVCGNSAPAQGLLAACHALVTNEGGRLPSGGRGGAKLLSDLDAGVAQGTAPIRNVTSFRPWGAKYSGATVFANCPEC